MATQKAIRECAEAMAKCLELGWSRAALDELEKLWWQCHLRNGELKSPEQYKAATDTPRRRGREGVGGADA